LLPESILLGTNGVADDWRRVENLVKKQENLMVRLDMGLVEWDQHLSFG